MWRVSKIVNGQPVVLGIIDMPADVMGCDLYEEMVEQDWLEDISNYDVDGDSEHVAVMGKSPEYGDFSLDVISPTKIKIAEDLVGLVRTGINSPEDISKYYHLPLPQAVTVIEIVEAQNSVRVACEKVAALCSDYWNGWTGYIDSKPLRTTS